MIFNSLTFIFVCFLPCILLILLLEKVGGGFRIRLQNTVLLLFSLLFFAWSGTEHLKVLILLIVMNYVFGWFKERARFMLLFGVGLNLAILIYFKYMYMIVDTLNDFLRQDITLWDIVAPLGISFLVFQSISYLLDLYNGKADICRNFVDFALYMSYFPKLSQGPIVKYQDMEGQIKERHIRFDGFVKGIERFIIGLAKKVLIGDILAQTYNGIFPNIGMGMDAGTAWIAVISYTLGLYMDFSGYSDMAIGMASMMGFEFRENFNFPYLSTSVSEFWRRWHISLGAWFREYLYFPLGGSRRGNVYLNLFIVFLATGIWHGASWVYLLLGAYHGMFVVIERYIMKKSWYGRIPVAIRWACTFLIISVGWSAFNVSDLTDLRLFLSYLVGMGTPVSFTAIYFMTPRLMTLWGVVIAGTVILSRKKVQEYLERWNRESKLFNILKYILLLVCLWMCFITSVSEGYTPFLYFQF